MDWLQVFTIFSGFLAIIIANFGMFLWIRSESRTDERRSMDLIEAIKTDIKDFHGRLCAIEERRK